MDKEKVYVGTKIIKAVKMSKHEFRDYRNNESDGKPDEDGYKVKYEDGYESWSPKATFERAYREVTEAERGLITG